MMGSFNIVVVADYGKTSNDLATGTNVKLYSSPSSMIRCPSKCFACIVWTVAAVVFLVDGVTNIIPSTTIVSAVRYSSWNPPSNNNKNNNNNNNKNCKFGHCPFMACFGCSTKASVGLRSHRNVQPTGGTRTTTAVSIDETKAAKATKATKTTTSAFGRLSFCTKRRCEAMMAVTETIESDSSAFSAPTDVRNLNGIAIVPKQGGRGAVSVSQQAADQGLSLGAPPVRPTSGTYTTNGGIVVTSTVERLRYTPSTSSTSTPVSSTATESNANETPTLTTSTTSTTSTSLSATDSIENLIDLLDSRKGVLLTSSYEFPGRYARWSIGFVDPPIQLIGKPNGLCVIEALNERGIVLMPAILAALQTLTKDKQSENNSAVLSNLQAVQHQTRNHTNGPISIPTVIHATVIPASDAGSFSEEDRSRQPSLFSIIRAIVDLFRYDEDHQQHQNGASATVTTSIDRHQLGLYGAFGYDLTFQFEPIQLKQQRDVDQRDLVLYLPDQVIVLDQDKRDSWKVSYDFMYDNVSTVGMQRTGADVPFQPFNEEHYNPTTNSFHDRDTPAGMFAESVERAKREFAVGNLFEAVLSQTFREKLSEETPPSAVFRRLRSRNPAPYGFMINLGQHEYLVGASPEMFVRCEATLDNPLNRIGAIRVETCPISGTVARGANALEDAQRVKSLMMNAKEESELTMCTDVDRNDKSRICEPGTVQVIGRRQIEMYSRLIHTVDHVEGYLREQYDALDAFLCHTWAVTVTGAPKTWAIQFIEDTERSPRNWYGGAVGVIGFDGSLNTGLTLRTVRVKDGIAEVRAGATLLYDSSPPAEEMETELKASAMIDAIRHRYDDLDNNSNADKKSKSRLLLPSKAKVGHGMDVILIDHEDSFVHTLGNYLRQTGANVLTLRSGKSTLEKIASMEKKPDLVVLSPGPGTPTDFGLSDTLSLLIQHQIPAFGVCLGLQGMVEHFGGKLGVLSYPMHGKPSHVSLTAAARRTSSTAHVLDGLPDTFEVARYHSLHGLVEHMPDCLDVIALSNDDNIVMAIQHKTLPYAGVQFHPESILTSPVHGMTILQNALLHLKYTKN